MSEVTPVEVLQQVSDAVPEDCRHHIVVIGSLAAGYHFFRDQPGRAVRTKDVDCMLSPFEVAVTVGKSIAERLLKENWQRREKGDHVEPGDAETPVDQLPAIRLYPPEVDPDAEDSWFIEFLTTPESVVAKVSPVIGQTLDTHPTFRKMNKLFRKTANDESLGWYYNINTLRRVYIRA